MRKIWKKGMAVLLTAAMLLGSTGSLAMAEETSDAQVEAVAEAPATEAPATEAPATEAPATEAPATEPPATEAPATEAPATELPATEAPATEAPVTEPPVTEAPATEAPATETPAAEAPPSETQTEEAQETKEQETAESQTEKQEQDGVFTVKEKGYAIRVETPKGLKLPEGTKVTIRKRKASEKDLEKELQLAAESGKCSITAAEVFEIHFEADGKEVEIKERSKKDIKVTVTFDPPLFAGEELSKDRIKVFHIKDLTEGEKAEAFAQAEQGEEPDTRKAEELKGKVKLAGGLESVSFQTDGFSDYVFAAAEPVKETKTEPEIPAENETQGEEATEASTESETQTETETQAITTTDQDTAGIMPAGEGKAAQPRLAIEFFVKGEVPSSGAPTTYPVTITGEAFEDSISVTDESGSAVAYTYSPENKTLTIQVPAKNSVSKVEIVGLQNGGTYQVAADGNYIDKGTWELRGNKDYTSLYKEGTGTANQPYDLQMTEEKTISVVNLYTTTVLSLTDQNSKGITGGVFEVTSGSASLLTGLKTDNGTVSVKGLPTGVYGVKLTELPLTFAKPADGKSFEISEAGMSAQAEFKASPITVKAEAWNQTDKKALSGAEFKIKDTNLTLTGKNNYTLTGSLERGKTYTLEQTKRPYGYAKVKDGSITVADTAQVQTVRTEYKPTVVHISAVSKSTGKNIQGVTFEVRDSKGNTVSGCKWTSGKDSHVLKAKLEPGQKYTVVQTSVPDGYILANAKTFTVSSSGKTDAVVMENDTTKVRISRKGYDSRTKKSDGSYEYTNMKMLSGAVLEVQDLDGNVIERWTSTQEPHVIEGKLAAGREYKLVEITTPSGYEKGGEGKFKTKDTARTALVTMQTRKASGKIQVVKRAALNGDAVKISRTFYCALFLDENKTQMYEGGVKALNMTSDTVYATALFTNVPAGVYWVAETDRNGKVLNGSESSPSYTITITNEKLNLSAGAALIAELLNDFESLATSGYTRVSAQELKQSYAQQYKNYGGSAQAAAALAEGDGTVATGDNTNIILYIVLLAAAAAAIAAGILMKKKKKR